MRVLWMVWLTQGCAYISDKHEAWRLDPDDDGISLSEDCDSDDASVGAERAWYRDVDEDGYGDESDRTYSCEQPEGYAAEPGDCDDTDPTVAPGSVEICDGADNDCNGETDDGLPEFTVYQDMDGDGFGDPAAAVQACGAIDGLVENGNDCDDTNRFMQEERTIETYYNGIDDNCDIADGDGDADGDGHWAEDYVTQVESMGIEPVPVPEGMGDDCDDEDATVFPGADDVWYDGVDSDCGGEDDCDIDGDGFQPLEGVCGPADAELADCNDHNPEVNPAAVEICASDADENCDGDTVGVDAPDCTDWFQDLDSDGFGVTGSEVCQCAPSFPHTAPEGGDCNDFDTFYNPDAFEIPRDGRDHDCAGDDDYDWDVDGYVADSHVGIPTHQGTEPGMDEPKLVEGTGSLPGGDCDDDDPAVNPAAAEICDDVDNDCDMELDEGEDVDGCISFFADADSDGYGNDDLSVCMCRPTVEYPVTEGGDCVDDEVSDGSEGWVPSYYPGAPDAWYDGEDTDCAGNDDHDQDGDGHSNADFPGELTFRLGEPLESATEGRLSSDDCDDSNPAVSPDATEVCDGLDNDCNGLADDDVDDAPLVFHDGDGDGFGDPETGVESCEAFMTPGFVLDDTDCDDVDGSIFPGADEVCDGIDNDCNAEIDEGFLDLDVDGSADCVDPVVISDMTADVLTGSTGSFTGGSLLIGDGGEVFVGAPVQVGTHSRVYVLEDFTEGAIELEEEATLLRRATPTFGWSLDMMEDGSLLVGSSSENAVIRVDTPLVGHELTYIPGTSTIGDTFGFLGDGSSFTPEGCGSTVAAGAFIDAEGSEGVFVGCTGTNEPSFAFRNSDWVDHDTLGALGWEMGTGLDLGESTGVEQYGFSVAIGDLNGDGIEDILVTAPRMDESASNSGSAYAYFGPVAEDALAYSAWDARVMGSDEVDGLGRDIQVLTDLDGDGIAEVLLSTDTGWSPDLDDGLGAVLIYSGSAFEGSLGESDADVRIDGVEPGAQFGHQSVIASDADGDGAEEIIISAYGTTRADGSTSGAIYGLPEVWTPGTRSADDADARVVFGEASGVLGYSMVLGDVGADGTERLLIADVGWDQVWVLEPSELFPD